MGPSVNDTPKAHTDAAFLANCSLLRPKNRRCLGSGKFYMFLVLISHFMVDFVYFGSMSAVEGG